MQDFVLRTVAIKLESTQHLIAAICQPSVKLAGRIWRTSGPSELLPPRAGRTCGSMRRACAYQHDIPSGFTLRSTAVYRSNPNFDVNFIFHIQTVENSTLRNEDQKAHLERSSLPSLG
jgi:hypothetical protein